MRISNNGNDLLITDQALGLGAIIVAAGVYFLASAIWSVAAAGGVSITTLVEMVAALVAIPYGLNRLRATQLIVDPDTRTVTSRVWGLRATQEQSAHFDEITAFDIVPKDRLTRTTLVIRTAAGDFAVGGGTRAARDAWEEVRQAVTEHIERNSRKER